MAAALSLRMATAAVFITPSGSPSVGGVAAEAQVARGGIRVRTSGQQKRQSWAVRAAASEDDAAVSVGVAGTDEEHGIYPSGEWPANFSLSNYEDLSHHYSPVIFRSEAQPDTILADVMTKVVHTASPEDLVGAVKHHFDEVTGLPVVGADFKCVGVLSRKDLEKSLGGDAKVKDVMTSPAITIPVDKTVRDAAVVMLKEKVHRLPVTNDGDQVVGIVTRTDIFTALEGLPSRD